MMHEASYWKEKETSGSTAKEILLETGEDGEWKWD